MSSRKPVALMLALGAVVIAILTCIPYTLTLAGQTGRRMAAAAATALAPAPDPALMAELRRPTAPQFDVATWYGARQEEPERHGVLIETYDGRHVFATHNADTPYNPASLVKLATSLVALERLGKDYRFETRVYIDGRVDAQGTLQGDLYLAGADPSFGDTTAALLGRELHARGLQRVSGKLFVTPRFSFNLSEQAEDSAKYTERVLQLKPNGTGVAAQPQGTPLFVLRSYPLHDILLYMNAHSVNFIAHRLGDLFGGADGVAATLRSELKLPPEQVQLESTSGLENNRLTPRGLLAVLHALVAEARRQGLQPQDILPVASCDVGTLRRRMAGTGFEGAVVGKTGTLTQQDGGMSNLGGLVYTKDEGVVLFVILAQGQRIWDNKQMADELLAEALHDHPAAQICGPDDERRQLLPARELQVGE